MKRRVSLVGRSAVVATFLTVLSTNVAYADSTISDITQGLASSNLFVSDGAEISNANTIESSYLNTPVAIVVLGSDSSLTMRTTAEQVQSQENFDTVIVVKGNDSFVVSSGNISQIESVLSSNSDIGVALVTGKDSIVQATSTVTTTSQNDNSTFDAVVGITGGFISSVLVIVVIAAVVSKLRGEKSKERKFDTFSKSVPDELSDSIKNLKVLWKKHSEIGSNAISLKIEQLVKNASELVKRVDKRGSSEQKMMISVKYADIFDKLSGLLGDDYYLDIYNHRHLWSRPTERMKEVERKLNSVDAQILDNIRQINESQDLDFRVALELLLDNEENDIESVYGINDTGDKRRTV